MLSCKHVKMHKTKIMKKDRLHNFIIFRCKIFDKIQIYEYNKRWNGESKNGLPAINEVTPDELYLEIVSQFLEQPLQW